MANFEYMTEDTWEVSKDNSNQTTPERVIVTRHPGLVDLLTQMGLVGHDTPIISHATANDVRGKDVVGVLPLHLAALAKSVTEMTLNIPAEMRGVELTTQQCREFMTGVSTYTVMKRLCIDCVDGNSIYDSE